MLLSRENISKYAPRLLIVFLAICFVRYFSAVVAYVFMSFLIAVLCRPVVRYLTRLKLGRVRISGSLAAAIVNVMILVVIALLLCLLPVLMRKVSVLASVDWHAIFHTYENKLSAVTLLIGRDGGLDLEGIVLRTIQEMTPQMNSALSSVMDMGMSFVIACFSVTFISFFFLRDETLFSRLVSQLSSEKVSAKVLAAHMKVENLLSRYFTGLLIEDVTLAMLATVILLLLGTSFQDAVFIGVLIGMFNLIPYAGPLIAALLAVLVAAVSNIGTFDIMHGMLIVLVMQCCLQLIDNFVLQPLIYSNMVKAHPLEVFLVILIAGNMGGMPGMIVAIPLYTILRVYLKEFMPQNRLVRALTSNI